MTGSIQTPPPAPSAGEVRFDEIRRKVGLVLAPAVFLLVLVLPFEQLTPEAHRLAAVLALGCDQAMIAEWECPNGEAEGVQLHDDRFLVTAVAGSAEITAQPGTLFSLMALPEAVVSVGGARWNLEQEPLAMGARGMHNEVATSGHVRVECHTGKLLLLEGNFSVLHN